MDGLKEKGNFSLLNGILRNRETACNQGLGGDLTPESSQAVMPFSKMAELASLIRRERSNHSLEI